ncbi:MAG TPA: hypothetical protein VF230_02060 [Acidimicrobiales bacterium]
MSDFDLTAIAELLPEYLGKQRWFSGNAPKRVDIEEDEQLAERLLWMLVDADGKRYQLLVGAAPTTAVPDFLHGHDAAILGVAGDWLLFDGLLDADLARAVLERVAPGEEVRHVRPMGAEQSNTSLVCDERLVLKVFRRVHDGANPDIEVTTALGDAGFAHVAAPTAVWERDDRHLAVVQPFLTGATDGWALALTSLRDAYGSDCDDVSECGGDFAAEARRLGEVTAGMHLALADAFGTQTGDLGKWVGVMHRQLERIGAERPWREQVAQAFHRFAALPPGPALRVHGDYHLGQVVRTDTGWYVLDFEGEPNRPLDERRIPSSPLKDVSGMLRSLHYAAEIALRERDDVDLERLAPIAAAWEERNRKAFLRGYLGTPGVDALLPGGIGSDETMQALRAWELDKAVYEVGYEVGHRPDWVAIPESAVQRILEVS